MKILIFISLLIFSFQCIADLYKWTHSNGETEIVNKVPVSIGPHDTIVRIESSNNDYNIIQNLPSSIVKPNTSNKHKNPNVNYIKYPPSTNNQNNKSTLEILNNAIRIRESHNISSENHASNVSNPISDKDIKCKKYKSKYDYYNKLLKQKYSNDEGNRYRKERRKYSELIYRECR